MKVSILLTNYPSSTRIPLIRMLLISGTHKLRIPDTNNNTAPGSMIATPPLEFEDKSQNKLVIANKII